MKTITFMIFTLTSLFLQDGQLNGRYKVEFDKKYARQGYEITFRDGQYTVTMPDAVTYSGKIAYGKFRATLQKNADDDPIEIDNREFMRDTIKFATRRKRDLSTVANRGRMIKMK